MYLLRGRCTVCIHVFVLQSMHCHVGIGRSTLHQYLRSLVLGHCTLALSQYTPALLLHVLKFIIFNEISKVEKTKHPEFSLDIVKCDPTSST